MPDDRRDVHDLPTYYLLLSTRDEDGKAIGSHRAGWAGAVLTDLLVDGHVELRDGRLHATPTPPQDERVRQVWRTITDARKPRRIGSWHARLMAKELDAVRQLQLQQLVDAGILRREERSFGRVRYPTVDPTLESMIRGVVADAMDAPDDADDRMVMLISLMVATNGLSELAADRPTRVQVRKQANAWRRGYRLPDALAETLKAVTAAVAAG